MTKYVVSGYIGFDNFGDEAIASVLTSHLKQKGAEKITLISSNPSRTSQLHGVHSVGMLNFIRPIKEADVLISGGGSLLQDVTSLKSLLYYLVIIMTALIFNKRVIIFAQGFTPFRTNLGKFLTGFVLKRCHSISVRDAKSKEMLKEMGLEPQLVSDPVFGFQTPKNISHQGIGVQLRNYKSVTNEFLDKLTEEISKNFANQEIKLYSLQDSIDLPILERFSKKLSAKGLKSTIYKNLSVEDVTKEIASLEYLVGMRFHAALVAALAGVKVLGINYDIKVSNLANTVGFPLIGLAEENFSKEFELFLNLNSSQYRLPDFIMHKDILL